MQGSTASSPSLQTSICLTSTERYKLPSRGEFAGFDTVEIDATGHIFPCFTSAIPEHGSISGNIVTSANVTQIKTSDQRAGHIIDADGDMGRLR